MPATILTITDDLERQSSMLQKLRAAYFTVLSAQRKDDVLRCITERGVDVALVDWDPAEEAATDYASLIKTCRNGGSTPVFALTSIPPASIKTPLFDADFDDFVSPTAPSRELFGRLRALARLRAMKEELAFRCATGREFGLPIVPGDGQSGLGRALVVGAAATPGLERLCQLTGLRPVFEPDPSIALAADRGSHEAIIITQNGASPAEAASLAEAFASFGDGRRRALLSIVDEPSDGEAFDLANGSWIERSASPYAAALRLRGQVRRARLTRRLHATFEEGLRLSARDELTGVFARRYVDAHLRRKFIAAQAAGAPLSLMLIDVDRFKEINDAHGHGVGDEALRAVAARLCAAVRGGDLVGRVGGEEFLVVMPDASGDQAWGAAERIRAEIAATPFVIGEGQAIAVTVSVGVAELTPAIQSTSEFLRTVDAALYRAKRGGRDRVVAARHGPDFESAVSTLQS